MTQTQAPPATRIHEIDAVRGFALGGILVANIGFFADPGYATGSGVMPITEGPVALVVSTLVLTKFLRHLLLPVRLLLHPADALMGRQGQGQDAAPLPRAVHPGRAAGLPAVDRRHPHPLRRARPDPAGHAQRQAEDRRGDGLGHHRGHVAAVARARGADPARPQRGRRDRRRSRRGGAGAGPGDGRARSTSSPSRPRPTRGWPCSSGSARARWRWRCSCSGWPRASRGCSRSPSAGLV
ncbi:hypothetical protein [Nonomuraea dietziae]|uniref:hypothetical protein n=1 Tax=Nonomuraea dietziae TaxID=65515 RepID=UPI0031D4B466